MNVKKIIRDNYYPHFKNFRKRTVLKLSIFRLFCFKTGHFVKTGSKLHMLMNQFLTKVFILRVTVTSDVDLGIKWTP